MKRSIDRILGVLIALGLLAPAGVAFATIYSAGSLLQTGDVKTEHVLNGTLLDADISGAALISGTKIAPRGTQGDAIISNGTTLATTSLLSISTSTNTVTITASSSLAASTSVAGVYYRWPSSQGAANSILSNDGAGTLSWANNSAGKMTATLTAGESITAGQAIAIGDGTTTQSTVFAYSNQGPEMTTTGWQAHNFTTPSTVAELTGYVINYNCNNGSNAVIATIYLETDSSGSPSGTILHTYTDSFSCNGSQQYQRTLSLPTPLSINASTKYWIVTTSNQSTGTYKLFSGRAAAATNGDKVSTNGGSTWGAAAQDLSYIAVYSTNVLGAVYKASAAAADFRRYGFAGIAATTASQGQSITIDIGGISTATTTGTVGGHYYLSDTQGALTTAAGTGAIKVGIGLGSAGFLLRLPNP